MRLIIISNRLPLTIKKHDGSFEYKQTSGGLVTGLKAVKQTLPFLWLGNISGMDLTDNERKTIIKDCWELFKSTPVFITAELNERSYNGFCNGILWPILHIFPDDVIFSQNFYDAYKEYNKTFCDKVVEIAEDGDIVWVHDYHLMLLPQMLRERVKKKIKIGFFLHVPFSIPDVFGMLPVAEDIVRGILGSDHIAFHSFDYLANFLANCRAFAPLKSHFGMTGCKEKVKYLNGNVDVGKRNIRIDAIPIGIDPSLFRSALQKKETKERIKELKIRYSGKKIILGVDRTDFIKGIPNRIKGYQSFLEKSERKDVVFLQIAVPSRTDVTEYAALINTINRMTSELNGSIGKVDECYFQLLNRSIPFEELCALYAIADCCLISSLIDGMNLVALEFIACQEEKKGVLLLSEFAGSQTTLPGSVFFNPWNINSIAEAIKTGVEMNGDERVDRFIVNRDNVNRFTAVDWAEKNIHGLRLISEDGMNGDEIENI